MAITAASLVAGVTIALAGPALGAVNTAFQLEGDVLVESPTAAATTPDWGTNTGSTNSIFVLPAGYNGTLSTALGVPANRSPLPSPFFDAGFAKDFIPGSTSDTTTYTVGSKDIGDIASGWTCKTSNNVTDKGDIQNAYAAVGSVGTHLVVYFGMEKNSPNGDNNMGVWLLQDGTVGCSGSSGNTAFTGHHVNGDIFLVAAFTNGGVNPIITAYKWVGGAAGALTSGIVTGGKCGTAGSDNICAVTNGAQVTTPWLTVDKSLGQGTKLGADQFYEGAVDLTANNLDKDSSGNAICTNKFVFNTRSSQQTSATLYDYAEGAVHTCFPTSISTLLKKDNLPVGPDAGDTSLPGAGAHTVTLPATVYDTSTLTAAQLDPTGTVTYSLWRDSACTVASTSPEFANSTNVADPVAVGSASPGLLFENAGDYWWKVDYTPSATSRNTASSSTCSDEPLTVVKPQPTIVTAPNHTSITIGGSPAASFNDVATVSGGYFPSGGIAPGTVTFTLYGPFASAAAITATSCTTPLSQVGFTNPASPNASRVDNTTATATSGTFTPTAVGVYQWTAKYNGNDQNLATTTSACGDTSEQVTVQPATPTLATTMLLSDKVKVTGVANAGAIAGTVDFQLFPSADCSGSAVYTENGAALASGIATTTSATLVTAGTYSWKVTFHPSAGSNYTGAATTCTAAQSDEKAAISYAGGSPIS